MGAQTKETTPFSPTIEIQSYSENTILGITNRADYPAIFYKALLNKCVDFRSNQR